MVNERSIASYNKRRYPAKNDDWNITAGLHTCAEHFIFEAVRWAYYGVEVMPITAKMVIEYLEKNPCAYEEAIQKAKNI